MFDNERLDAEIVEAVVAEWEERGVPLLLSRLGLSKLSDDAKQFVRDNQVQVKRHIRSRLADQLRLVPMKRQGGGVAPLAQTGSVSDEELEEAFANAQRSKTQASAHKYYDRGIWRAFADSLPQGSMRVVRFDDEGPVVSLQNVGAPPLAGEYAITEADVVAENALGSGTYESVRDAITAWCDRNDISSELVEAKQAPSVTGASSVEAAKQGGRPVGFIDMLKSLPKDQLKRISIPGDVVLTMLENVAKR